ncbi:MAG: pseudaminic acid cytidylyltransferase [Balneolaceae bacterium]|nr:pseudaminic acid cytidylyltransferase [Saccharospirillum sp.]MCH8550093.1 pseudaminic acid cytidylyltransferase [Balneolaceae bacterium]
MNIAIIPARGGSKRIPKKNIKDFCGKPIIAWSIEAALDSNCFDRIIVSTDDMEIAEIATRYGAEVPFIRKPELSDDYTGTQPVIADAIDQLKTQMKSKLDLVCCIYATAPLICKDDIALGYKYVQQRNIDFAFTITEFPYPIQRALKITAKNKVAMFQPEHGKSRSQDLEQAWHDAGQFYWGRVDAWLAGKPMFGPTSMPIKLPRYRVQDIDTLDDWVRAELMYKAMQHQ